MSEKKKPWNRGGRPKKIDPASHRYTVNLTAQEHARFLSMYEQSGLLSKALFIKARIFGDKFHVVKTDRGTLEYVAKLTQFHAQFRAIGVNYNQLVKHLKTHYSERAVLSILYKLEKITGELAAIGKEILAQAQEFEQKFP